MKNSIETVSGVILAICAIITITLGLGQQQQPNTVNNTSSTTNNYFAVSESENTETIPDVKHEKH